MQLEQLTAAILTSSWSNEQLNEINSAVAMRRQQLQARMRRSLTRGDRVQFTSGKTGRTHQGTVTKVAQKFATVETAAGGYRVPMNMLTFVD